MKKNTIISFDIYDTLIERIIPPEKIYNLLSIKYNISDFRKIRIAAETKAKEMNKFGYTIYDIYNHIDLDNKEEIMNYEIQLEITNTKRNIIGERLYNKYKKNNCLICISDMYFTEDIIKKILIKNGYDKIKKIYVSCEYNASKRNKKLFKIVRRDFKNNNIVHIGDSIRSDCFNAIISGFKVNYIGKNKKNNYSKKINKKEYVEYLGYHIFGPIIFEFCIWLNKNSNSQMIFLSREGDLLCKCYNELFQENKKIIYVSRKSVISGILFQMIRNRKIEKIINLIRKKRPEKVKDLLRRINLLNFDEIFGKDFIELDVNEENIKTMINLIYDNENYILDKLYKKNEIFNKYINEHIKNNTSFVDVGWNGSMQNLLSEYLKKDNKEVNGFYLGCLNNINKKGFLFSEENSQGLTILNYSGIIELIFMPSYGSVIDYQIKNSKISPVLDKYEFTESSKIIIENIQKGYLEYLKDRKKLGLYSLYNNNELIDLINELGLKPSKFDLDYFGNIEFYDNCKSEKLINYNSGLIKSFIKSEWKVGYLKKLFKIPIPYNKLLLVIRRGVKK